MAPGINLTFVDEGFYYNFKDIGKGFVKFGDLVGALASNSGIEITLRDGKRIYLSDKSLSVLPPVRWTRP